MSLHRSFILAVLAIGLRTVVASAQEYSYPAPEAESPTPEASSVEPPLEPVQQRVDPGPFAQGRLGLSLGLGNTFAGSRSYLMLGMGVSVYVLDGLAVGLDGNLWLLDEPFAGTLTPHVTYTFHFVPAVKPYVGTFVRHYMIGDDYDDSNSLGLRAGIYIAPARSRAHFGAGLVYERQFDCDDLAWSCDDLYPEAIFAISL